MVLRPRRPLRTTRRRGLRRLSLRLYRGSRRRHAPGLLRRGGHEHRPGHRQHKRPAGMAGTNIRTKEDFLERDPYEVFHQLRKKVDPTLCRCALASIVGAKTGAPWHRITKKTAAEYERRHPRPKWGP